MKQLLFFLTVLLFSTDSFSQDNCKIEEEYGKIFKVQRKTYRERTYLQKTVNKIASNSCLSELVNDYGVYIDYLRTNFSDLSDHKKLIAITDSIELQETFIRSLEQDSAFNAVMHVLTSKFLGQPDHIPDTVSMNDMLDIAVNYFSIQKINEDQNYVGKVCVGINGLAQTIAVRKPQLEAFCFTAIFTNYQGERFSMYDEFVKGIRELYKMSLGVEDSEKLLRAQGAMYMFMRNNEQLRELLRFEYEDKKKYLPFVLID